MPHRLAAAFLAMVLRFADVSFAARALPPLTPPRRPRATAAGFFFLGGGGKPCGCAMPSESACSIAATSFFFAGRGGLALFGAGIFGGSAAGLDWLVSRCLLERLGMPRLCRGRYDLASQAFAVPPLRSIARLSR